MVLIDRWSYYSDYASTTHLHICIHTLKYIFYNNYK